VPKEKRGRKIPILRSVCDYVQLHPVRVDLLHPDEPISAYPWSSLYWYTAAPSHRPSWIRVDRLLGEHGLREDTPATRAEFLRRMEDRHIQENDELSLQTIRRGWCHGSAEFKQQILDLVQAQPGPASHLQNETSARRADRILAEGRKADELFRKNHLISFAVISNAH
jgi:hypothetical protein